MSCNRLRIECSDRGGVEYLEKCAIPFCLFLTWARFLSLLPSSKPKGCLTGEDNGASVAMAQVLDIEN